MVIHLFCSPANLSNVRLGRALKHANQERRHLPYPWNDQDKLRLKGKSARTKLTTLTDRPATTKVIFEVRRQTITFDNNEQIEICKANFSFVACEWS